MNCKNNCKIKLLNKKLTIETYYGCPVYDFCRIIVSPTNPSEREFWIQCKACNQLFLDESPDLDYWNLIIPAEERLKKFLINRLIGKRS